VSDYFLRSEDELFDEVVSAVRASRSVPAAALTAARLSYRWRSVAAAIAGLEFDSAVDHDDLARVRDAGSERRLRFRGGDLVAEVSVIDGGSRLIGRLEPPIGGSVILRHPGEPDVAVAVDDLGQFMFESLPQGAMSLMTVPSDPARPTLQTEWVTI